MRKIGIITVLFVMIVGLLAYGAPEGKVEVVFDDALVSASTPVTSRAFICKSGGYFGAWIKNTSVAGTPDVDIIYQMSPDTTSANFATPSTAVAVIDDSTSEKTQVVSISPPPMKYIRFVAYSNGSAAGSTDTTVKMKLFTQE